MDSSQCLIGRPVSLVELRGVFKPKENIIYEDLAEGISIQCRMHEELEIILLLQTASLALLDLAVS